MKKSTRSFTPTSVRVSALRRFAAFVTATLTIVPMIGARAATVDLRSTQANTPATAAGTIRVGNSRLNVQVGQMLTPAEALALSQVVQSGRQTLILGAHGNAVRGVFNASALGTASGLVIPRGVTGLSSSNFNFGGDLVNSGRLFLYSTTPGATSAGITATNIFNNRGALLSTVVPATLLGGTNAVAGLSLDLSALNNIINAGIIRSAGSLNLTAGRSIVNSGTLAALQAANNISLNANTIVNSGRITATTGNINIAALNPNTIYFNNTNGTLQALLGSINVRDAAFGGTGSFNLMGGNLLSKTLNIFSGCGAVDVLAKNISGIVNVNAGSATISSANPNLQLGQITVNDDPTFFNTLGSITINSPITTGGGPLAIVAKGDILSGLGADALSTANAAGNGGSITLIAGANFTSSTTSGASQTSAGGQNHVVLTINGASSTGGKIDLTSANLAAINSFTSAGGSSVGPVNGNGGDITVIAYKGSSAGSGTIALPENVDIDASGHGTGTNGNVLMIGNGILPNGNTISIGSIADANSGGAGANNVGLFSATPVIAGGQTTISDGALSGTPFSAGTLTVGNIIQNADFLHGGVLPPSAGRVFGSFGTGTFTAKTAGAMEVQSVTAPSGITMQTAGIMIINGGLTANSGAIDLKTTKNGTITYGGNIVGNTVSMDANGTGSIFGLNHSLGDIPLSGSTFALGVQISPDHQFAYVPDFSQGKVFKVNVSTNTVVSSWSSLSGAQSIAVSPDSTKLYVVESNGGNGTVSPSHVTVLDASTSGESPLATFTVPGSITAESGTLSPDGNTLYVIGEAPSATFNSPAQAKLFIIDVSTPSNPTLIKSMPLVDPVSGVTGTATTQSGAVVLNPQGTLAYVSCSGTKNIYVVDVTSAASAAVTKTINLNTTQFGKQAPIFMAMDPGGQKLYVSEGYTNNPDIATQINNLGPNPDPAQFNALVKQQVVQGSVAVIDVNPTSSTVNKLLSVIALPTSSTPGAGSFPQGISPNPTGTELYVQSTYLPQLSDIYTGVNRVVESIPVSAGPDGYGSNNFSTIVNNGGVNNVVTFTSNTFNLQQQNSVSVVLKPTIQATNGITLKTGGGNILVDYDAKQSFMSANAGGLGAVIMNNVGSAGAPTNVSQLKASSAPANIFQIGTVAPMQIIGNITASKIILQSTDYMLPASGVTHADITIGDPVTTSNTAVIGSTGSTVSISTGAGDIIQGNTGSRLVGKTIDLHSLTGNIGNTGPGKALLTQTAKLSAATGGTGNVDISNTGAVTLTGAAAGNLFALKSTGLLTVPSTINGVLSPRVTLSTTGSNIVINAQLGIDNTVGNNILLDTGLNTGSVTMGAGNYKIFGDALTIICGGSAGTSSVPLRTNVNHLDANAQLLTGSVFVNNTGHLFIDAIGAGKTYSVVNSGDITVTNSTTIIGSVPSVITLQTAAGSGGNIEIGSNLPGGAPALGFPPTVNILGSADEKGGTVTLIADGAITDVGGGTVAGDKVTLQSSNGDIGSAAHRVFVAAGNNLVVNNKSASPNNNVFLDLQNDYFLSGQPVTYLMTAKNITAGGTVNILSSTAVGATPVVQFAAPVAAPNIVIASDVGTNGSFILAANIGLSGGSLAITTDGTGSIVRTLGSLLSAGNTLTANGGIGIKAFPANLLGSPGAKIFGSAPGAISIAGSHVLATSTDDVFLSGTSNLAVEGSAGVTKTFSVSDNGTLTTLGTITAGNIALSTLNNHNIDLSGLTAGSSITVNAAGSGSINIPVLGTLTAPSITLTSGTGNIGSTSSQIVVAGGTVSAKTGGKGSINLLANGAESIGTSSAGGSYTFTDTDTTNDVTIVGGVTAPTISISSGRAIIGPTLASALLSGTNVTLTSGTGATSDIGSSTNHVLTKAANLFFTAGNDAFISNSGSAVTIGSGTQPVSVGRNLNFTSSTPVTIGGNITTTALLGSLKLTTTLANAFKQTNPFALLSATNSGTIVLTSTTGNIGSSSQPLQTESTNLTVDTKGQAFVNSHTSTNTNLNAPHTMTTATITTSAGDLTIPLGNTVAAATLKLSSAGNLNILGTAGNATGVTTLFASSLMSTGGSGQATGKTLTLITNNNDIGTLGTPLNVASATLQIDTNNHSLFLTDSMGATVKGVPSTLIPFRSPSTSFTQVQLTTAGNVTLSSPINSSTISVTTTNNGNITINNVTIGKSGGSTTTFNAGGTGSILATGTGAVIAGDTLSLTSGTGSIGKSTGVLKIVAVNVSANTSINNTGTVFLSNTTTNPAGLTITNSTSGGAFSVTNNAGNLTVSGTIDVGDPAILDKAGNNLTLTNKGDNTIININNNITVTGGNLTIQEVPTDGTFNLGNNTTVKTMVAAAQPLTNGVVKIAVGPLPTTFLNSGQASFPASVVVTETAPGKAFAGANPFNVQGPATTAQVNAVGRNVVFNVANDPVLGLATGLILFGDGANVTADPPGLSGATAIGSNVGAQQPTHAIAPTAIAPTAIAPTAIAPTAIAPTAIAPTAIAPTAIAPTAIAPMANAITTGATANDTFNNLNNPLNHLNVGARHAARGDETQAFDPDYIALVAQPTAADATAPRGSMLLVPDEDVAINTAVGTVHVGKGAVVLLVVQPNAGVSIYDLHDNHVGDVSISIDGGTPTTLSPGRHLSVATGSADDFAAINPFDTVSHRQLATKKIGALTVFTSEFSIPSAMRNLLVIAAMTKSHKPQHVRITEAMLKNAAILMQLNGAAEPYQRFGSQRPKSKLALTD